MNILFRSLIVAVRIVIVFLHIFFLMNNCLLKVESSIQNISHYSMWLRTKNSHSYGTHIHTANWLAKSIQMLSVYPLKSLVNVCVCMLQKRLPLLRGNLFGYDDDDDVLLRWYWCCSRARRRRFVSHFNLNN